jgi:hypothetical protein
MQRISTATKANDLFGAGKHGFKDGNLALAIAPTDLEAAWCNVLQEEVCYVVEQNGITLDGNVRTQLYQAIQLMIAANAANDYKTSVRVATTANIAALAGGAPNTLDGVALAANDRILVKDQTTGSQNGIYVVTTLGTGANGTWSRASDADQAGELTPGAQVTVEEGTLAAESTWVLSTDGTITIGATSLTFVKQGSSTAKQIQPIATPTLSANALTLPSVSFTLDFRSATLGAGGVTAVTGAPAALTIPAGATLGTVNAVQSSIVDIVLAGGNDLTETGVISTTAISAGATAANVVYSNTARTNVPYRVVGRYDSTQATAGQWATAPSLVVGSGGQALAAMSSLGYGQTWQNVTGSRASGVTYYNLTGRPIMVSLWSVSGNSYLAVNGVDVTYQPSSGACVLVVPPGSSYRATLGSALANPGWYELR